MTRVSAPAREPRNGRWGVARGLITRPGAAIFVAALVLFLVISPLVAPTSVQSSAFAPLVVFGSILVLASFGQMLVVQQGGFDLSVPGAISLAAVGAAHFGVGTPARLALAILLTLGATVVGGFLNGLAVTFLRIPPLIATLGMNALLLAATQVVSNGVSTVDVPNQLATFAQARLFGVPAPGVVTLVVALLLGLIVKYTIWGRRFELSGDNPKAALFAGIRPRRFQIWAYAGGGLFYGIAGLLLAGYVRTPGINSGDPYLFASVAAVVLGGAVLSGGKASTIATLVAAVFLTQLTAVVTASGAAPSLQYIIQAAIICVGVGLPALRRVLSAARRRAAARGHSVDDASEDSDDRLAQPHSPEGASNGPR
jgi:ribose transport system permease protein